MGLKARQRTYPFLYLGDNYWDDHVYIWFAEAPTQMERNLIERSVPAVFAGVDWDNPQCLFCWGYRGYVYPDYFKILLQAEHDVRFREANALEVADATALMHSNPSDGESFLAIQNRIFDKGFDPEQVSNPAVWTEHNKVFHAWLQNLHTRCPIAISYKINDVIDTSDRWSDWDVWSATRLASILPILKNAAPTQDSARSVAEHGLILRDYAEHVCPIDIRDAIVTILTTNQDNRQQ